MQSPAGSSQSVAVDLGDGMTARVEVARQRGEVATGGAFSFDQALGTIRAISGKVGQVLKDVRPTKASITYGLELEVENGGLIATLVRGKGSATFEITLEWETPSGS
jgi:hypothetical protein